MRQGTKAFLLTTRTLVLLASPLHKEGHYYEQVFLGFTV